METPLAIHVIKIALNLREVEVLTIGDRVRDSESIVSLAVQVSLI